MTKACCTCTKMNLSSWEACFKEQATENLMQESLTSPLQQCNPPEGN